METKGLNNVAKKAGFDEHIQLATTTNAFSESKDVNSIPELSQSNAVGQGFDVFGEVNTNSFLTPLLDPNKAQKKVFTLVGKDFLIPTYINPIENTSGYYEGGTYMSRNDFQNSVAVNVQATAGYGLFSGEMKAAYKNEFSSSSEYAYTYNNFYSSLAVLQLAEYSGYLRDSFVKKVADLPESVTPDNLNKFIAFFNEYGIYYTDKIELGGSLEFYVSVAKSAQMSEQEISAMMKAQYDGLFVKGSISSEITSKESWKKYSENSQYHISVTGGDPSLAGALTSINPLDPSQSTVNAYKDWLNSVSTSAAITNMKLKGIWMLCGDKSRVVQEAWLTYSETIHPKITLETSSYITFWPITQKPVTPIITVNGFNAQPSVSPISPVGYQALILSNDAESPRILYNKYFSLDPNSYNWMTSSYPDLYQRMTDELSNTEFNKKGNILILCSFGLGLNLCPTEPFYRFLKLNGAGSELEYWETHCDPGSQMGNQNYWMVSSMNYVLASQLGNGPDVGNEVFDYAKEWNSSVNTQLTIYLFKDSINGKYTIGS